MRTATSRRDARIATEKKKMAKKVRVASGKHQGEPTCDNCAWMTLRKCSDGNHRHCDQLNLYIPDREMYPTCDLHTWLNAASRKLSGKGVKWETSIVEEGGAA